MRRKDKGKRRKRGKLLRKIVLYAVIIFIFILVIFPLYYLVLTSLKPWRVLFATSPKFLFKPTIQYYNKVFIEERYYLFYGNSLLVASAATGGTLGVASLAAFAFVRFRFQGSTLLIFFILLSRMYMPITTAIPVYMAAAHVGLLDTRTLLILVYIGGQLPLAIYVLRNFFGEIPKSILESAEVDGCTPIGTLVRIILPLSVPALIATSMLVFLFCWNEFLFALITTSFRAKTAPVVLGSYLETESTVFWGELAAIGFSTTLPTVIFMVLFKRYLIKGFLRGAVKG